MSFGSVDFKGNVAKQSPLFRIFYQHGLQKIRTILGQQCGYCVDLHPGKTLIPPLATNRVHNP